jgi:hypothetical protein
MDIASGLAALKTASDLTRFLRDAVKSGGIKDDELSGRIGEIYDYIIDSKAALIDASEEIHNLRSQLLSLNKDANVFLDGGVNWEK